MPGKGQFSRWFAAAALIAALGGAVATGPAEAQRRQFLEQLFGGGGSFHRPFEGEQPAPQADYSRAPAPHKPDAKTEPVVPTTSILVMGDAMADWLAYGLEDAFSDMPEIAVIRKNKRGSGLLRYEYKSDLDWWRAARDILAQEKADYVVMMMGVSDHQNIGMAAKEADKNDAEQKAAADNAAQPQDRPDEPGSSIIAPKPKAKTANGVVEFRSDKWAEIYSRRIDATVAALKSKGVPVFWVGLPAIRGTKATADAGSLNQDLYRARVERAGAIYIDVWDGFVDEAGKFTTQGPDFEGQVRRLRSWDGVYFTKAGARKLAHYVEREIRRYMSNRAVPLMFPTGPGVGPTSDLKSTVRPLAGPVLPLTVTPGNANELAGGGDARPTHSDAIAAGVLVKGDPVIAPSGRADDFSWPRNGAAPAGAVSAAATAAPEPEPKPKADIKTEAKTKAKSGPAPKAAQNTETKPKVVVEEKKPKPPQHTASPRPQRPIGRNPFETLFGR